MLSYSKYHINAIISTNSHLIPNWKLTCLYGEPQTHLRPRFWALFKYIQTPAHMSWICIGDLNEVLDHSEKLRGAVSNNTQIALFKYVLSHHNLTYLGCKGPKYTWKHGFANYHMVERLDRDVANDYWKTLFQKAILWNLQFLKSDHCPILLNTYAFNSDNKIVKIHYFERYWQQLSDCQNHLLKSWYLNHQNSASDSWMLSTSKCLQQMKAWEWKHPENLWN